MNFEQKPPINQRNVDAYRAAVAKEDPYRHAAEALMRNAVGYEAVADPDKALRELDEAVIADAMDALNPQHQPGYEAMEGGRFDALNAVLADPHSTYRDAQAAHRYSEASISSHPNNTHTLSWEARPEVTIANSGEVIENLTPPSER